jgi:hypothetical protein
MLLREIAYDALIKIDKNNSNAVVYLAISAGDFRHKQAIGELFDWQSDRKKRLLSNTIEAVREKYGYSLLTIG